MEEKESIIFAYFVNNEFQGARCDSFGTIRKDFAKVYTYSKEQIGVIKDNVTHELSHSGSRLLDMLFGKEDELTLDLKKREDEKREWGEFELRVYKWIDREEWYDACSPGEEWKRDKIMKEYLGNEPLETHKFKTIIGQEN